MSPKETAKSVYLSDLALGKLEKVSKIKVWTDKEGLDSKGMFQGRARGNCWRRGSTPTVRSVRASNIRQKEFSLL